MLNGDPVLTVSDEVTVEGNIAQVEFRLSKPAKEDVRIQFKVQDSSAVQGADYTHAGTGSVVIPKGATRVDLAIATIEDEITEPNEDFHLIVQDVANAQVGDGEARILIVDDDARVRKIMSTSHTPAAILPADNVHVFVRTSGIHSEIVVPYMGSGGVMYRSYGITGMQSGLGRLAGTALGGTIDGTLHIGAGFPDDDGQVEIKLSRAELENIQEWLDQQRAYQTAHGNYPYSLWSSNCADFVCAAISQGSERMRLQFGNGAAGAPWNDADTASDKAEMAGDPYTEIWIRTRTDFARGTSSLRDQYGRTRDIRLIQEAFKREQHAARNENRMFSGLAPLPYEGWSNAPPVEMSNGHHLTHPVGIAGIVNQ